MTLEAQNAVVIGNENLIIDGKWTELWPYVGDNSFVMFVYILYCLSAAEILYNRTSTYQRRRIEEFLAFCREWERLNANLCRSFSFYNLMWWPCLILIWDLTQGPRSDSAREPPRAKAIAW